jgi:hypothetical protein
MENVYTLQLIVQAIINVQVFYTIANVIEEHDPMSSTQHMHLERIEVTDAHYLGTRVFGCHAIHVLCSANTLVLLLVLPANKE